jgi:hypothetical protein
VNDDELEKQLAKIEKRAEERRFREEIVARVRDLSKQGKIRWRDHAFDRIDERGIDALVATRILQRGDLKNDLVEAGDRSGEWVLTMVDRVKSNRDVGVVTVVVGTKFLRVITVEWEDL